MSGRDLKQTEKQKPEEQQIATSRWVTQGKPGSDEDDINLSNTSSE